MFICCMAIPTPHIISIIWPSLAYDCPHLCEPFTPFLSSSSTFFLCRLLGVNFLAHAHPLHECSKYRKRVDQFDLYLASGLGTSPDKNPKETKCETLVDSCSQQPFFLFRPSPLLARKHHLETFESRTTRALAPLVLLLLVLNANIDSCLLRLELNRML